MRMIVFVAMQEKYKLSEEKKEKSVLKFYRQNQQRGPLVDT